MTVINDSVFADILTYCNVKVVREPMISKNTNVLLSRTETMAMSNVMHINIFYMIL